MDGENIISVNVANIVSITLMAMLGFLVLHAAMAMLRGRASADADAG